MALQGNGANLPKKLKEILLAFLLLCNSSCPKKTNKALVAVAFNDGYTDSLSTMTDLIYYKDRNIGTPSCQILSTF